MIRLEDTSGGAVSAAIAAERHRMGSPATGMVLTLLILSDEEAQADATAAAVGAARQHPMRIVTLIPRPGKHETRLDAEISVGGDDGPGEVAVLRLRGLLAEHANSVAVPLLLSDTPVVAYWPEHPPEIPADDPIGRHAQRRITDCATQSDALSALRARKAGYRPGDTDLCWTRITPWRSVLASALDQPPGRITSVSVSAEDDNASAVLLALWLGRCLKVPVTQTVSAGPLAEIIAAFHALTGVPMVLNTSFNRAGEPIVESACDAVRSFLALDMRALWLGGDGADGVLLVKRDGTGS